MHERANKTQVRIATEEIFDVRVTGVRRVKAGSRRGPDLRTARRRWKKAIVTLHPDDTIELFEARRTRDDLGA